VQGDVDDVVACAAEYFFGEDNGKCSGNGNHPKGSVNGENHWEDQAGNEESFLNFLATHLSDGEFDAKANNVCYNHHGEYSQESVEEEAPEWEFCGTGSQPVLVTGIVHAKDEAGQEG